MTAVAADSVAELRAMVAGADVVVPVGGRTHWEVGGSVATGTEVRAPSGVLAYDPAELTVSLAAGTTVAHLADTLGDAGQECPLDPRVPDAATVGGTLAAGLSGHRRLRYGPLRDRLLEVHFVTADGRFVRGGGPTVKNVTGFDLPRLLIGSLGTIGVMTHVVLRCQPRPAAALWCDGGDDPFALRRRAYRPSCIAWDGTTVSVLVEGSEAEVAGERSRAGLDAVVDPPGWPDGAYRGRISVRPSRLAALGPELHAIDGLRWTAEVGVGTVHVAADDAATLVAARVCAETQGGWLLREQGLDVDAFGAARPGGALSHRVKEAFDPTDKLAPGRLFSGVRA
jgi:glycolate oxidase FAD binding subunit